MTIFTTIDVASAAAEGRPSFVDTVLNGFVERTGRSVDDAVRDFILEEVLHPEADWQRAVTDGDLDAEKVHGILIESLDVSAGRDDGSQPLGVEAARLGFYEVIHDRWHCPFPFIFC